MENREIHARSLALAGATLTAATLNGLMIASAAISVFMPTIAQDYGWSHAQIGGAVSLLYVGLAIGAPVFGPAIDRFGPRFVALASVLCSGVLLGAFSVLGKNFALFCAAHLFLGFVQIGTIAQNKMISMWFFRRRAIALTAVGIGIFVAQVAFPPVARSLLVSIGWHDAYRVFGACEVLISFPALYLFFREPAAPSRDATREQGGSLQPDGAPAITLRQALASRTYWLLLASWGMGMFGFMGISTHGLGILTQHHVDAAVAVWGLSFFGVGGLASQLLTGLLLDHFGSPKVIVPFAIVSVASLLLVDVGSGQAAIVGILLFGLGCGGQTSVYSYLVTRYFGVRNYSKVYGTLFPLTLLASVPAPILIGAVFDRTGSYHIALVLALAMLAGAVLVLCLLQEFPYPLRAGKRTAPTSPGAPVLNELH